VMVPIMMEALGVPGKESAVQGRALCLKCANIFEIWPPQNTLLTDDPNEPATIFPHHGDQPGSIGTLCDVTIGGFHYVLKDTGILSVDGAEEDLEPPKSLKLLLEKLGWERGGRANGTSDACVQPCPSGDVPTSLKTS
jgi:hypothetical protein